MTLQDLKSIFKSAYQFNKITKMSPSSWMNWIERGYIPIKSQVKIEKLTNGKLKADLKHVEHRDNE